jgi:probable HAF family extracellular repeat protein
MKREGLFRISALTSAAVLSLLTTATGWSQSLTWLGTLPGYNRSIAYGVSAGGDVVVGESINAANQVRAFRWENGVMQDLGTLLGGDFSVAFGVSAGGNVVVGWAENAAGQLRAFRWTAAGGMEDLNITYADLLTLGSWLEQARAISPDGRYIVGYGYNADTGRFEGYLLDTIPEPASLLALGVGLQGWRCADASGSESPLTPLIRVQLSPSPASREREIWSAEAKLPPDAEANASALHRVGARLPSPTAWERGWE